MNTLLNAEHGLQVEYARLALTAYISVFWDYILALNNGTVLAVNLRIKIGLCRTVITSLPIA
jgi:hypothetical protein